MQKISAYFFSSILTRCYTLMLMRTIKQCHL